MCKNLQILIDTNQCLIGYTKDDLKLKIFFLDLKFNLYYIFLSTICKYGIVKVARGFAKYNHRCTRFKIQGRGQLRVLPKSFGRGVIAFRTKLPRGGPKFGVRLLHFFINKFFEYLPGGIPLPPSPPACIDEYISYDFFFLKILFSMLMAVQILATFINKLIDLSMNLSFHNKYLRDDSSYKSQKHQKFGKSAICSVADIH